MNIHEYQSKQLLLSYGLPVPKGIIYNKKNNLEEFIKNSKEKKFVVKSQIHAGGRGAGFFLGYDKNKGGVRIVNNFNDLKKECVFMLGKTLITKQTGPQGKKVNTVYIEEATTIIKEYYLSILINRKTSEIMVMFSASGGINIEEIASKDPSKIYIYNFKSLESNIENEINNLSEKLYFNDNQKKELKFILKKLMKLFNDFDASSIEINPLVINNNGSFVLLDAKISFDDNALFRQPIIADLRDENEEDPFELEAAKNNMNYIKLNGSIGCMVNGAGLAMATMDIIKYYGSEPANFLDLGGTADQKRATEGFKIIQSDKNVKSILINIFGGIIRCDMIAEGIINAAKDLNLKLPVIVRFQGTNAKEGRNIINNSGLNIIAADSFTEATKKSVESISK